jgi:hypothetical protein
VPSRTLGVRLKEGDALGKFRKAFFRPTARVSNILANLEVLFRDSLGERSKRQSIGQKETSVRQFDVTISAVARP